MTLTTEPPLPGRRGPDPLTKWAILAIIIFGLAVLFAKLAHADPVVAAPPARAAVSIDWGAIGGIIGAIAGAIGAIFGGISMALHAIAPRTKTTADDKLVARIDSLHAKVDDGAVAVAAVFSALRALRPVAPPPAPSGAIVGIARGGVVPESLADLQAAQQNRPPRDPQAGFISGTFMVGICATLMVVLVAVVVAACATGKVALAEGSVAFLECEDGHLDAQSLADMKTTASAELRHLIAGKAAPDTEALKADMAPVKSDLGRCGWAAAIAALGALMHPESGVATSALVAGPDPAQARAAFGLTARALGWAPIKLAGGDVL